MGDVFNWQINRKMPFPYKEHRPAKQAAWVFDLNKCIGCQTCTMACKTTWTCGRGQEQMFWNNVETKPYGFFPLAWDQKLMELLGQQTWKGATYQGKTVFEAGGTSETIGGFLPDEEDWAHPNLGEDETSGTATAGMGFSLPHLIWMYHMPRICNHCTYPACLAACPRKAIYKRSEDGIVLVDQSRCRGYRECMRACPYKKIFYNLVTKVSEKCIGCYPLVEEGDQSRCSEGCIGKIRLMGLKVNPEHYDPANPIDFLVHEKKLALPLYPQSGTEPNVYYIPPLHVPLAPLQQVFGPGAAHAQETYKRVREGKEPEIQALLHLFGCTHQILGKFQIQGEMAIGYDASGKEIVKVPLREPIHLRKRFDAERDVARLNIT